MYDLLVKNALVMDGSGGKPFKANVGVAGDTIAVVASRNIERAKRIVDASGLVLCPGFIDIHTHTDLQVLRDRDMSAKVRQGITTDVSGNCGIGVFPNSPLLPDYVQDVLGVWDDWAWDDFSSYKRYVERGGIGINEVFLVSHTALRLAVLGEDPAREADGFEIERMCRLLETALGQGALGLSSGLYYSPCLFASREELLSLLRTLARHGALFAVHHRCEGNGVVDSLREVLDLAKEAGCRLEVSHLKAIGMKNQDKVPELLELIRRYREEGLDVGFDQYPYNYGSTSLFSLLPPRILGLTKIEMRLALSLESERAAIKEEILHPEGWDSVYEMVGPDNITVLSSDTFPDVNGKKLSELGDDPLEALFDLLSEETGSAVMTDVTETEESLRRIMADPLMTFGTDSLYSSPVPHPRSFHSTVRFLGYARDGVMSYEEAIRRMTGANADKLGLVDRGYVREGFRADLLLLDLENFKENGSGNDGLRLVLVNGMACYDGRWRSPRSGRVVTRFRRNG